MTQRSSLDAPEAVLQGFSQERARLLERLPNTPIDKWMHAYTDLIDGVLIRLYEWAYQQASQEAPSSTPNPLVIIATGGYGRRELAPFSDIDLTFVPLSDHDPFIERMVKHLYHALMSAFYSDTKLKVGYAYRLIEDCEALDDKTRTGLLDMRPVVGSPALAKEFSETFWRYLDPTGFVLERYQEYQARRAKQGEGILRMEPHLKEGIGGLRDRHTLNWMTQARFGTTHEQVRPTLIGEGILTESEANALENATLELQHYRALLHACTQSPRDHLTLASQEQIAEWLGLARTEFARQVSQTLDTHARLTQRAIERLVRAPLVLGIGLDSVNLEIVPAPALERESPEWCLWVFQIAQKYHLNLSPPIEARIESVIQNAPAPDPTQVGICFSEILSRPGEVYRVLAPMARLGVLEWALPALHGVMHLPAGDPTHEFTVGEHTLQAIRLLDQFTHDTHHQWHSLMEQVERPEVLYMAMLLHDVGKLDASRSHSEVGAEMAEALLQAIGWDEEARAEVVFLVYHHLLMAQTARQRDLQLPETIREFTRIVNTPERLTQLYLLTCADTQAVGERIWTPAQASFLKELYRRALRALEEGAEMEPTVALGAARKRLMRALAQHPLPEEKIEQHIAQMPSGYLLNTPPDQISLHILYVERVRAGEGPVVEFLNAPDQPHTELTICTYDDPEPGLLSKITGVLYAYDVEVSSARVLTREDEPRVALDTLWITVRQRPLTVNQCAVLEKALRKVLSGEQSVAEILRQHQKDPDIPLQVSQLQISETASDAYTVIDLHTRPDAGALYRASYALSRLRWNIHSARLGQWAGRSVLSFYCTDANGNKIQPEEYARLQEYLQGVRGNS